MVSYEYLIIFKLIASICFTFSLFLVAWRLRVDRLFLEKNQHTQEPLFVYPYWVEGVLFSLMGIGLITTLYLFYGLFRLFW